MSPNVLKRPLASRSNAEPMVHAPTPKLLRLARGARVIFHLLGGLVWVLVAFPFFSPARRRWVRTRWSRELLRYFGFTLRIEGALPEQPGLIAANHVSWIDIFAVNALTPVAFVSKDDVIHWPIIGTLARHNETIFLQRGSRGHAHTIGKDMARRLESGSWLAVFPEGTTTDGSHLHPFHAALLQPAIDANVPVTPVALCYEDTAGQRSLLPAYTGDTSLWESFCAILSARQLVVRLIIGTPVRIESEPGAGNQARKRLAHTLHDEIEKSLYA
jgi:1-acyl-sn-glycerol-3-phosphate acyltransferase